MANMATRVRRAWEPLLRDLRVPAVSSVAAFRRWLAGDLLGVSRELPPRLEDARANPAWRFLLTAPVEELAVSRRAWDAFAEAVRAGPPPAAPLRLLDWAKAALWSLGVFTVPDDACDNDQYDLELWAPQPEGPPVLVCGMGECFRYRHRHSGESRPLHPWTGDP
ncbi:MAG: hypothetical protein AAF721_34785, partial [Myxococcota bacterium]